jgi:hypothetical protein
MPRPSASEADQPLDVRSRRVSPEKKRRRSRRLGSWRRVGVDFASAEPSEQERARRDRHLPRKRQRLFPGAGHAAADARLRPAGLTRCAGGPDAPRHGQLLQDLVRFRRRATDSGLSPDHILDNITLYWLTGSGASAARAYWEGERAQALAAGQAPPEVSRPVGFTTFPVDLPGPAQLGREVVPQPHLLQRGRGRSLRRVGRARALLTIDAGNRVRAPRGEAHIRVPVCAGLGALDEVAAPLSESPRQVLASARKRNAKNGRWTGTSRSDASAASRFGSTGACSPSSP